ncbi:type II toxin-antitoxin system RelE/ParE family toxin [Hydrogenophaga sp. T2]|uniref:type II toxin-antitoxin system RelE/ParE family toxin n=1 Tax=Hydrogenophaga sp. T2 TaxID=3132823 RepID=UPI003CE84136
MAIYTTRWFNRWARKHGLADVALCAAVREMRAGLVDADLGGGLFKKANRAGWARQEWRLAHAGCNPQGTSLDLRFWLPEE